MLRRTTLAIDSCQHFGKNAFNRIRNSGDMATVERYSTIKRVRVNAILLLNWRLSSERPGAKATAEIGEERSGRERTRRAESCWFERAFRAVVRRISVSFNAQVAGAYIVRGNRRLVKSEVKLKVNLDICKASLNTKWIFQSAQIWQHTVLSANKPYLPFGYGTHFTVPRRAECWVDLRGWLLTETRNVGQCPTLAELPNIGGPLLWAAITSITVFYRTQVYPMH